MGLGSYRRGLAKDGGVADLTNPPQLIQMKERPESPARRVQRQMNNLDGAFEYQDFSAVGEPERHGLIEEPVYGQSARSVGQSEMQFEADPSLVKHHDMVAECACGFERRLLRISGLRKSGAGILDLAFPDRKIKIARRHPQERRIVIARSKHRAL
jgi:hypothetical protein